MAGNLRSLLPAHQIIKVGGVLSNAAKDYTDKNGNSCMVLLGTDSALVYRHGYYKDILISTRIFNKAESYYRSHEH